jgi:hypothetical protein
MSQRKYNKGSIVSLVSILSVVVFLLLGFIYNMWHPGWIVFFAAPVTAAILNVIEPAEKEKGDSTKDDSAKQ